MRERIAQWRMRARLWLDFKVPIPLNPKHIGSTHNFVTAHVPPFTYKQHLRLLTRTFLREVCGV